MTVEARLDSYSLRLIENGIGVWPRCTAHLTQTTAGWTPWSLAIRTMTGSSMSTVSSGLRSRSGRVWRADWAKADRLNALVKDISEQLGLLEVRV